MNHAADFLIVGGGIAGASLAWQLAGTRSVTLLEAEPQPGMHATGRSAAFFSEIYGNATIRSVTAASRAFFESPPGGFAEHPLLEPCGCLIYSTPAQHDALQEHYAELQAHSPGLSLQSANFARERVPVLQAGMVSACIWEPDAKRIDVNALLQGVLRGARAQGAQVVTDAGVQAVRVAYRDRGRDADIVLALQLERGEEVLRLLLFLEGPPAIRTDTTRHVGEFGQSLISIVCPQ